MLEQKHFGWHGVGYGEIMRLPIERPQRKVMWVCNGPGLETHNQESWICRGPVACVGHEGMSSVKR